MADYLSKLRSKKANHQPRGPHGEFVNPNPTSTPPLPNPPNTSILTLIWNKLSKLTVKKITVYGSLIYLILTNGPLQNYVERFFPNSSPILRRVVVHQGILKQSGNGGYQLVLPDNSTWTLLLKPSPTLSSLKNLNEVVVKGNLTSTPFVIENAEIYPLNISTSQSSSIALTSPISPTIPKLFPSLVWETEEEKLLVFTSGKRRLDMQGVHLESSEVKDFPQPFLDYYTKQLTSLSFKQTLNSKDPDGVMETYAKEGKYLTFGVKNIFAGSGDNKTIAGYKAYIEHN